MYAALYTRKRSFCKNDNFGLVALEFHYGSCFNASLSRYTFDCFNCISVNTNPISVRLKSKQQRINTITFYLRDISTALVGVAFKHIDQIREPLIYQC